MPNRLACTSLLAAATLLGGTAFADTVYVDLANPNCPGSGTAADPFCLIQDGIDAAVAGDVVSVAPGVYTEASSAGAELDFRGKAIAVQSSGGRDVTEIVANAGPAVVFRSAEGSDSVLAGFTISGSARGQDGIAISTGAQPTLVRNSFRELGIAVRCAGTAGFISRRNRFSNSTAAIMMGGGVLDLAGGHIRNCEIAINATQRATVTAVNCLFMSNVDQATDCLIWSGSATYENCRFVFAGCGGIQSELSISDCTLTRTNVYASGGPLTIDRCEFKNPDFLSVETDKADVRIRNSFMHDAGVVGSPGGFWFRDNSTVELTGNTYAGNRFGPGSVFRIERSNVTSRNDIYWDNDFPMFSRTGGSLVIEYSDVERGRNGTGNVDVDPLFVDPANDDYRLQPASPVIDAGDPVDRSCDFDAFGGPRTLDGTLDGDLRVDMGAHEFGHVHLEASGSTSPGGVLTLASSGTAGLDTLLFVGVAENQWLHPRLGCFAISFASPWTVHLWPPLPSSVDVTIPAGISTPLDLVLQELATSGPAGNTSNPVRLTIE